MAQEFQIPPRDLQNNYEAVLILHPDATEEEQKQIVKKNIEIVKSFKGELNHVDTWGKRKLANPIDKNTRGTYIHMTFKTEGGAIAELERVMKINDKVLRYAHTRLDNRISLAKHVEAFKEALAETLNREKERDAKNQAKKAAFAARRDERGGDRGDRGDRGERSSAPKERAPKN
jgi:small subunit ribosomal protein S6